MQLGLSFSLLLATLLFSLSSGVQAAPAKRGGLITLPLKRITHLRDDVHPTILLQQHINRGLKRHAYMTGRSAPTKRELQENIDKRLYLPASGPGSRKPKSKRYNRQGVAAHGVTGSELISNKAAAKKTGKAKAVGAKGAKGKGAAAKGAAAAGAAGAAVGAGAAGAAGAAANSSSNTGPGFSEVDLDAANNGGLTVADAPATANSLGLDIEANDVGYIATIQMGTPPQNYNLLMDSGSADLWVGGENCVSQSGGGCGNHTFLGTQSSSTFVDSGKPFAVTYGSGNVAGDIVTDNINVAGLALNAHTFGVATSESVDFSSDQTPFDGLMGLAQSVDPTKFSANTLVTFANVNTQGFWEGAMTAVTVNGQDLGLQGRTAILDTGTTLVIAPPADAAAVHEAIPGAASDGQGGFTIPCTSTASVALTFGGQAFAIDPRDLLFAPVDPTDLTGDCVSGISSGQIGGADEWLVGDVFLKNAYFSTDVTNNQISLAELV
ncbi:hypothetical protein EW026_g6382 [Hermanssonia centrifuga]|uniref:Peptidase A1 domain-containing protein n=1 Tax=Hermanssonia centrifuga TaxID=98765 RepID=A0A4S4KB58_9APHY|nr:hypothetical protein EW026_g6382 [Hermanssonia centrifuga]